MNSRFNKPLKQIRVTPLASESFGVRSMCTLVETPNISLLLDAGISLCPYRFNLPPHPIEFQTINRLRRDIADAAEKADVVTISHYHFDHHTPSYADWIVNWTDGGESAREIYQNKTVLVKNPKENINVSQRERAKLFLRTGGKHAKKVETADSKAFFFGETIVKFSCAVPHGAENSKQGWVIMTTIKFSDERFMFAPDIQGPMAANTLKLILEVKPDMLMLGGPPLYLAGSRVDETQINFALKNLEHIVEAVPNVILEHHTLRDELWREKCLAVLQKANKAGHNLSSAAEYLGKDVNLLEAKRKQLYNDYPPSEKFERWIKTLNNKNISKPPIET